MQMQNEENVEAEEEGEEEDSSPIIPEMKRATSSSSSSVFLKNQLQLTKQVSLDIDENLSSNEYTQPNVQIKKIERLQDPTSLLLKKNLIQRTNQIEVKIAEEESEQPRRILPQPLSSSIVNSELGKNLKTTKEQLLQKQYSSSSSSLTQTSGDSKIQMQQQPHKKYVPQVPEIDKTELDISKKLKLLLHTDSLSSDPSDSVSQRNSICLPKSNNNNNQIDTIVKSKKLPSILSQQSNIMSRIKRGKTKVNKQYSLSSSDECEDYEVDDVDYEMRSTTEYNDDYYEDETNDETEDLESGSISDKGAYLMKLHRMENEHEKEVILAEKMEKFLSVRQIAI